MHGQMIGEGREGNLRMKIDELKFQLAQAEKRAEEADECFHNTCEAVEAAIAFCKGSEGDYDEGEELHREINEVMAERDSARAELEAARKTNKRLNREKQRAESALAELRALEGGGDSQ